MRRPNARELYNFPRLIFPDGWAVNHREDIDVPITNADGTDNTFGCNRTLTIDTVAVRTTNINIDRHIQMLKTRSAGQKRQREAPGFDKDYEYRNWIASHGDVAGDLDVRECTSHRRVTFDDETFRDTEEVATPAPIPTAVVNTEWGIDGDDFPYPSTEHRERVTRRLAPSRRMI